MQYEHISIKKQTSNVVLQTTHFFFIIVKKWIINPLSKIILALEYEKEVLVPLSLLKNHNQFKLDLRLK